MTKPRTCASCDNPASDGITICRRCERDTRRRLGDMEALREELELTMTRQAKMQAERQGSRSTATPPLTFAEDAAELLHEQRNILVGWCKIVMETTSVIIGPICRLCEHRSCSAIKGSRWPEDRIGSMSRYIEHNMPILRKHEAAGDLVDELATFTRNAMSCIDYPDDRHRVNVAPCVITTEAGPCIGRIVLHYPHDGETYADCATCGTRWNGTQLNRLGQRINKAAA